MTEPTTQHLYVMQNEFGCVKIGRSIDPWQRVHNLRQTEHCRVELVAAFEGGGEDEEAIHIALDDYRLEGEWFDGTDAAREAIKRFFEITESDWKFSHDPASAEKWLDHLRVVRAANYIRNAISRQLGILRAATEGSWVHDGSIFYCWYLVAHGERPGILVDKLNGQTVNFWVHGEWPKQKQEVIPAYTSSVELALFAWPDDLRPSSWDGTAIECCIAALVAMRQSLPKVPRRTSEGN